MSLSDMIVGLKKKTVAFGQTDSWDHRQTRHKWFAAFNPHSNRIKKIGEVDSRNR